MEEQPDVSNPVQQPTIPTPTEPKNSSFLTSKLFLITLVIVALFTIVYAGIYLYLGSQLDQISKSTPIPLPVETSVKEGDPTADWETHTVNTLQLEFKLPPKFTTLGKLRETVTVIPSPFKGKELCVTFPKKAAIIRNTYGGAECTIHRFVIRTVSSDYNVGRGAGFVDLQGFVYENGEYYAKLLESEFEIPSNLVQRINNKNGVEIVMIKSTYTPSEEEPLPIPIYYVGDDIVGALVNTSDKTFSGFAVLFELKDGLTERDFDQILSTFKFTN